MLAVLVAGVPALAGCASGDEGGEAREARAAPRQTSVLPACAASGSPRPSWSASFAGGTFGEWSSWQRGDGGTYFVTTPAAARLPELPECVGPQVAQFGVDREQARTGNIHSKLYKAWDVGSSRRTDDADRPFARMQPGGEGGVYSAWYYIPRNYRMRASSNVNIFQFKEDYKDSRGGFHSDVQSCLSLWNARTLKSWGDVRRPQAYDFGGRWDRPLLAVSLWHRPRVRPLPGHQRVAVPAPLGRWFNVAAVLRPGERVTYWIDGRRLDTWQQREYPVGVRYRTALGWTFGIGHYGSNVGRLWAAGASFTPFTAIDATASEHGDALR